MIELTLREKVRVFGMYIGCDVVFKKPHFPNISGKLLGNNPNWNIYISKNNGIAPYAVCDMFFVKLQLIDLKDVSDEDAILLAEIMYPKDKHNPIESLVWGKEIALEITQGQTDKDVIWFAGIVQCLQFLCSRGYAIPLFISPNHPDNGKTPIELGLAIAKTK